MSSNIQHKRRINGAAGSPPTTGALEGQIAFNAPNAAGSTDKPDLFFYDGVAWRNCTPAVAVSTQSINLGAAGADIGAGYTAWAATPANVITGNVVIATWGTPAQAYVLTNAAAPNVAGSWTSLGGAVSFASAAEIHAGTDTTKAVNSAILRGETVTVSTGVGDADKLIRLNAAGVLDATLLSAVPSDVKGAQDVTAALTGGPYKSGDIVFSNAAGTVDASWTGAAGSTTASGDALIYDGAVWYLIPNKTDLNAYLALVGGTMGDGAKVTFDVTTGGAGTVVLDLATGGLDNAVINCGTF